LNYTNFILWKLSYITKRIQNFYKVAEWWFNRSYNLIRNQIHFSSWKIIFYDQLEHWLIFHIGNTTCILYSCMSIWFYLVKIQIILCTFNFKYSTIFTFSFHSIKMRLKTDIYSYILILTLKIAISLYYNVNYKLFFI